MLFLAVVAYLTKTILNIFRIKTNECIAIDIAIDINATATTTAAYFVLVLVLVLVLLINYTTIQYREFLFWKPSVPTASPCVVCAPKTLCLVLPW